MELRLAVIDPSRLTLAARFDLGRGWSMAAGAQGYAEMTTLGTREVYLAGAVFTYKW